MICFQSESEPVPASVDAILSHLTVLSLSHELSDGYDVALDMHTDFAPFWKGRYLSSNVNITVFDENHNPVSVPVGERFVKFKTRKWVYAIRFRTFWLIILSPEAVVSLLLASSLTSPEMRRIRPCKKSRTWSRRSGSRRPSRMSPTSSSSSVICRSRGTTVSTSSSHCKIILKTLFKGRPSSMLSELSTQQRLSSSSAATPTFVTVVSI